MIPSHSSSHRIGSNTSNKNKVVSERKGPAYLALYPSLFLRENSSPSNVEYIYRCLEHKNWQIFFSSLWESATCRRFSAAAATSPKKTISFIFRVLSKLFRQWKQCFCEVELLWELSECCAVINFCSAVRQKVCMSTLCF